ncbi:MAG: phosphate acetyltransferase [Defluviitaleaceae bacterium]|nr:phosphate acetyltransferase [Defluviitaleaceae bacterium]MCL2275747.1 phosphate acetyltransferase [Defluviitaleaceae bacterium]
MGFINKIKQQAKSNVKTIVLPESFEARNLKAAAQILQDGLAKIVLIGDKAAIEKEAQGLNLSAATFVDPANYEKMGDLANQLADLRKAKGMTVEEATEILKTKPLYLGVMLVKAGIADGMVAGAQYSTGDVMLPGLQILKTAPGVSLVSTFFVMVVPDCEYGNEGIFVFSDCGLVQNPDAAQMAAIGKSAADSYRRLIGEPIVAMLSHSTKGSAKHPDVDKVIEATRLLKEMAPDLKADGEFQLDAAIVPAIGASKAPGNPVAGNANVLVFPDLDSANIGYKLVERLAKAQAYGPITQGIGAPLNDLSRGCSVDDIVGVVAITAVQAQGA